jgi:hypothetical protein
MGYFPNCLFLAAFPVLIRPVLPQRTSYYVALPDFGLLPAHAVLALGVDRSPHGFFLYRLAPRSAIRTIVLVWYVGSPFS